MSGWRDFGPEGWHELSRLLDTALDLPMEARAQWLAAVEDSHLRDRLQIILARSARVATEDFLGALPALRATDDELASLRADTESPGDLVGGYRLIRELGRGGMSSVWLAERSDGRADVNAGGDGEASRHHRIGRLEGAGKRQQDVMPPAECLQRQTLRQPLRRASHALDGLRDGEMVDSHGRRGAGAPRHPTA